jgi:hypothetical protein
MATASRLVLLGCVISAFALSAQPQATNLQVNPNPDGERIFKSESEMRSNIFGKYKIASPKEGRCKSEFQYWLSPNGSTPVEWDVVVPPNSTITNVRVYSRENIASYPWRECPIALNTQCPQGGNAVLPYRIVRDENDQSFVVWVPVMNWSDDKVRLFRIVVDYN